ncbi:hypothetical protein HPP92_026147 [Vanilla planifolia]|uniref:Uncharacterized protein n=1 Tax=Vanilla planifolia TaxID=51239 RepID=A0A835PKW6_VANPL|nr:hypothetical protein HPP92_026147 [Vanilla planifolia]
MEFFKLKRFGLGRKAKAEEIDMEICQLPTAEERESEKMDSALKVCGADSIVDEVDEEDDDFITNEVKRRLKELRKNSFMVLIPEDSCLEEERETSSSEWRDSDVEDGYPWCDYDGLYCGYRERMLSFDKMIIQNLKETESWNCSNLSPSSSSKRLASTLKSLSFRRRDELFEDCKHLRTEVEYDPFKILETAYVAQICLSWEVLHSQFVQLIQLIASQPGNRTSYSHSAQEYQQFQVLLLRFIENEPFEQGSRAEIYARARISLPKLLQVPIFQGSTENGDGNEDLDAALHAPELLKVLEDSILAFRCFLKKDKKKSISSLNLFKSHNHDASSLHQVQASLDKKEMKVKELSKKKGWKNSWPSTLTDVELLLALIDIKVIARVLRMTGLSKEQLLWCEEKMSKLDLSANKLCRNSSPLLFPCST